MSLLFLDSFDHYDTADATMKWTLVTTGTGANFKIVNGGRTNKGAEFGSIGSPLKTFGPEYASLTIGQAYKTDTFAGSIFLFENIPEANASHIWNTVLRHAGDGRFYVGHDFGTQVLITTFVMSVNKFYFIELKATTSYSGTTQATSLEVRVNGGTIFIGSVSDTLPGGLGARKFASFACGAPGGGGLVVIDDLYVTDGEFLGDIHIDVLRPNGDDGVTAWNPSAAVAHYTLTHDTTPDGNATYVEAATVADTEKLDMEDMGAFVGRIKGAQALWCMTKSATGPASEKGILDSSGTEALNPEYFPSFGSYIYDLGPARKSPFTGNDWTKAEIDAILQGARRIT